MTTSTDNTKQDQWWKTYESMLLMLADVFDCYHKRTGDQAVIVGGCAVSIYTIGQFQSADIDFIVKHDHCLNEVFLANNFYREHGPNRFLFGFYHSCFPQFGFQPVSGPLFDGKPVRTNQIFLNEHLSLCLPSIEDMIADRLAQYAAGSVTDRSRLNQAQAMFDLNPQLDQEYLFKRISEESGNVEDLNQTKQVLK